MSYVLQIDSDHQVEFDPEYDFTNKDSLVQAQHRTRDGSLFIYKFGEYSAWKFKVNFISDNDKTTINDWWRERSELQFYNVDSATLVNSVVLMNKTVPVNKVIKPHNNLFIGTIDLSTY